MAARRWSRRCSVSRRQERRVDVRVAVVGATSLMGGYARRGALEPFDQRGGQDAEPRLLNASRSGRICRESAVGISVGETSISAPWMPKSARMEASLATGVGTADHCRRPGNDSRSRTS